MPDQSTTAETQVATSTDDVWPDLLARAIAGTGIRSVFQPIIDLDRCVVAGFEALTRFDIGPSVGPDVWFHHANSCGVGGELEAQALRSALRQRRSMPVNTFMTVNVEPESLFDPGVLQVFREEGDLRGLVIEITEHRPLGDQERLAAVLGRLRSKGAMIAVDDAGSGYAGLQQILQLRPSILKLDRVLIEGIDRDEAKAALVEMIGIFASRIDAWLLAEGVETGAEARRCASLGVPLVQGYFFARPAAPWATIEPSAVEHLLEFLDHGHRGSLSELLEFVPCLCTSDGDGLDAARRVFSTSEAEHVVVVDADERPRGVLTPTSAMDGEMLTALIANVHTSPVELAQRMSTRIEGDLTEPTVVTDNAGRYLGVVTVRRLLATLGSQHPAHISAV